MVVVEGGGTDASTYARAYVDKALAGVPGFALFDYGCPDDVDALDPSKWQLWHPGLAYATLAGEVWAWKELCRAQIACLEHWDYTDAKAAQDIKPLIAVYERALDRAQKALADMLRIGLTAEALRQAKERPTVEQAAALHGVIQGLLDRLTLTPEQQRAVPDALTAALQHEGLL